jgi:hypothetical protein
MTRGFIMPGPAEFNTRRFLKVGVMFFNIALLFTLQTGFVGRINYKYYFFLLQLLVVGSISIKLVVIPKYFSLV